MTRRIALLATALAVVYATPAAAQWSDRTELTFSEAVKVPGATLPAGSYIFKLVNPPSTQDVITVSNKDGTKVFATFHTVPMKRNEPTEDVIIMFNPTEAGAPAALKGWYIAGTSHGYQPVYSEEEARTIAERSKSIVLSREVPGGNERAGTIVIFNPQGAKQTWQQDPAVQREWNQWRQTSQTASSPRTPSTAPMVGSDQQAPKVSLDNIENDPQRFYGRMISVDAEVQEVLGPHLFKIDEPHWADLQDEVLVLLPANMLALVRENDRVTVTGTVKAFLRTDIHRESSWLEFDDEIVAELSTRPVIMASRVVGGDNNRALFFDLDAKAPVVMTPGAPMAPITSLETIAEGDESLVGRPVSISNVTLERASNLGGFVARVGDHRVFVLTANATRPAMTGSMTLSGVVLALPEELEDRLDDVLDDDVNDDIYIYVFGNNSSRR